MKTTSIFLLMTFCLLGCKKASEIQEDLVIQAGAFMRLQEAFIPVIKLDIGNISASFSYDITISNLTPFNQGRGGFEAGFIYRWYKPTTITDARCPRF